MARMSESENTVQTVEKKIPEVWQDEPGQVTPLGKHYPVRRWEVPEEPEAVDIDIVEMGLRNQEGSRTGSQTLHVPTHVLINGKKIFTPQGTKIEVKACGLDATTVTMTFFARRVRIGHADELLSE